MTVVPVDCFLDMFFWGQCGFDFAVKDEPQFFDGLDIERVVDEDFDRVVFVGDWNDGVFAGDRFGDEFDDLVGDSNRRDIDVFEVVEFREGLGGLLAGGVAEGD